MAELLRLSWPLILSNSIWTLQTFIDRVFLAQLGDDVVGATMPAVLLFWTPLILFQNTANYATTFVAQYTGAGRPERVGPSIWQALYFGVAAGLLFLLLVPVADDFVALAGHSPHLQELEAIFFRCLCFSGLPTLITAAASSFFAGRGDSRTVLIINAVGLATNAVLDYLWIFGHAGFPAWGIAGAGWATVVGMWASALLALALMFRPRYQREFATLAGWRFDAELFRRLMYFGFPSGLQSFLDALAWTFFILLIGRLGEAELAASTIAFTINMVAFMPAWGVSQGIGILVGQRLGQDNPELAERTTWSGFRLTWCYMAGVALLYVLIPDVFLSLFHSAEAGAAVAPLVIVLLRFVAVYSLFDGMNLVFAYALRGAGDTRFVTLMSLLLAWPIMVAPTWAAWVWNWGLFWAWSFASAYVIALALVFLWRFRAGQWKGMRVIEPVIDFSLTEQQISTETAALPRGSITQNQEITTRG